MHSERKLRVLVVDSSPAVRQVAVAALAARGCDVVAVASAVAGLWALGDSRAGFHMTCVGRPLGEVSGGAELTRCIADEFPAVGVISFEATPERHLLRGVECATSLPMLVRGRRRGFKTAAARA